MTQDHRSHRRRAWTTVAALFICQTMSSGMLFYGSTVYLHALTTQQGFQLGLVSVATATLYLANGLAGFPLGRAIDRFDPRLAIVSSAVLGALGLVQVGSAASPWTLFLGYTLMGCGLAGLTLVPSAVLVERWFSSDRALAMSVVSSGYSAGGVVFAPVVAWLVTDRGLSAAAWTLAAVLLAGVVPIAIAFVRTPASTTTHTTRPVPPVPKATLRTNRVFVGVSIAWFFVMFGQVGILSHLFNLVSDGASAGIAASAVSVAAMTSLTGRLVAGWLMRYVTPWTFTLGLMAWQAVSLLALSLSTGDVAVLLAAGAFGVTLGTMVMLQALILAEEFTGPAFTRVYAASTFLATLGWAAGPAAIGLVHDAFGGYRPAVLMVVGTSLLALTLLAVVRPRASAEPDRAVGQPEATRRPTPTSRPTGGS